MIDKIFEWIGGLFKKRSLLSLVLLIFGIIYSFIFLEICSYFKGKVSFVDLLEMHIKEKNVLIGIFIATAGFCGLVHELISCISRSIGQSECCVKRKIRRIQLLREGLTPAIVKSLYIDLASRMTGLNPKEAYNKLFTEYFKYLEKQRIVNEDIIKILTNEQRKFAESVFG